MPMSFEATVGAFAAALGEPSAAPPAMTRGRFDAPDPRRFSVYRNNVAVGLDGRARSALSGDAQDRGRRRLPLDRTRLREREEAALAGDDRLWRRFPRVRGCVSRARSRPVRARLLPPLAGEEQGGGSRRPMDDGAAGRLDNLQGEHDPPPTWHSEERPSFRRATPAPTGGGGCANAIDFAPRQAALACLADLARLENAWVEAYHAGDAPAATIGDLAALGPDLCPRRGSPFTRPRASCVSRRPPPRSGPALRVARAPRSRPGTLRKTCSSPVRTPTSGCASCRRSVLISRSSSARARR